MIVRHKTDDGWTASSVGRTDAVMRRPGRMADTRMHVNHFSETGPVGDATFNVTNSRLCAAHQPQL